MKHDMAAKRKENVNLRSDVPDTAKSYQKKVLTPYCLIYLEPSVIRSRFIRIILHFKIKS